MSHSYLKKSPLSNENLFFLKKNNGIVFDIVYKPKKTNLFYKCKKLSIKYINGLKMNSLQASKALKVVEKVYKANEK